MGEAIAGAIVRIADLRAGDLVLEIGAGTGEIGVDLAARAPRYLGLDSSPRMLQAFRAKAGGNSPDLVVADCDEPWPVADGDARVVFASRVIHLLRPDHVAREIARVCQAGGVVMLGRVNRAPDSLKERLRRRRQRLLREVGAHPRSGDDGSRQVIARLAQTGWADLGRRDVAAWSGECSARELLAEWESLTRMGSVEIGRVTHASILGDVREWATREFGDLDHPWPFCDQFVLDIAQRPERQHA